MRYIKRLVLNKKDPQSNIFAVEADGRIVTTTGRSLQLPRGGTAARPSPVNGMVRYNITTQDSEVYNASGEGTGWEKIKTNRQTPITPQNLGVGNYLNTLFGPLSYDVSTSKPQNIMVFVDNVYQIPTTNYTLIAGASVSVQATLETSVGPGVSTITLTTTTNVLAGQRITAPTGIQSNTTVTNVNVSTREITISLPTSGGINAGTTATFSYSNGVFIEFTGAVPAKQVFSLLGFDGYAPPNS
jgi:hypothetical protein